MSPQILIIFGSFVLGILGLVHFIYVLVTNKFHAYDDNVTTAMQQTSPGLIYPNRTGYMCTQKTLQPNKSMTYSEIL